VVLNYEGLHSVPFNELPLVVLGVGQVEVGTALKCTFYLTWSKRQRTARSLGKGEGKCTTSEHCWAP
jgi:hypothetical protein